MKQGLIVLLMLSFTACNEIIGERGNDDRITKEFTVDNFEKIEISGGFDITLTPYKSNEVILEVDENLVDYIDISVRGNKLYIDADRRMSSRQGIKIKVPVQEISAISSSGASNIQSSGPISSKALDIELSGAGKIDLKLDVNYVSLELSGATMVYLNGVGERLEVDMSGAGSLTAEDFEVKECEVSISGVGHVLVNVTGTLEAQVSGLGKVEYIGEPDRVKGDVSGIGQVSRSN
jgi:Putative auto-transporter adhesin, head GIN domain